MPEGHTIHRAARDQRSGLVGCRVAVSSPQGRFTDGAARLDGRVCMAIDAWGKHLVYDFDDGVFLHVHLGLFGRVRILPPGSEPAGEVRVRIASQFVTVGVNGPTACCVMDKDQLAGLLARLGPDPLREDADPDRAWSWIKKSRAPIGLLLMDQSVIAGIGNIYRTELLWRQRIHPATTGRALSQDDFERLWADAVGLLTLGVETGAIVTREGLKRVPKTFKARVNIFKKVRCPRCGTPVRGFEQAKRRVFVCETCAPPPTG